MANLNTNVNMVKNDAMAIQMIGWAARFNYIKQNVFSRRSTHVPVRFAFICLLLIFSICRFAFGVEAAVYKGSVAEKSAIIRFQQSGEFLWCGDKHLAISRHSRGTDAGIRLLDVENGQSRQITFVKTHNVVACTPDAKHLFFVDNGVSGTLNEIDIVTGKQQIIFSKSAFEHEKILKAPISPKGDYFLSSSEHCNDVKLSDRQIKALCLPKIYSGKYVHGVAWSIDGTAYIVFGVDHINGGNESQKILILRPDNAQVKVVDLPKLRNSEFMDLGWQEKTKRLLLLAMDVGNLYEFDPEKPRSSLKIIANNIDEFRVSENGNFFFIQHVGVSDAKSDDRSLIERAAHRLFSFKNYDGRISEVLRVPYLSVGISNIQASPTGRAIAIGITKIGGSDESTEIGVFRTNLKN